MPGGMTGRARQQRLQPCGCSSRGASARAFVVGAETRKTTCVGCDAVVYVVVSMHVSMRISAHVVCMYGAVEVYAWRVHHVHGHACDRSGS